MQSTVSRKNWFTHIDWMNGKKSEAAIRRCFVKKVFLKFRKIHRKTPETYNVIKKETLVNVSIQ